MRILSVEPFTPGVPDQEAISVNFLPFSAGKEVLVALSVCVLHTFGRFLVIPVAHRVPILGFLPRHRQ